MTRKWKRLLWISAAGVLLAVGGTIVYLGNEVRVAADRMYEPLSSAKASYEAKDPELQAWRSQSAANPAPADADGEGSVRALAKGPTEVQADASSGGGAVKMSAAQSAAQRSQGAFTVLLAGVDERAGDRGRTDTLMVLTVNEAREAAFLFSIPRDTYADLVPKGTKDKINHAYAFSGIEGTVSTVEHFLDIPIDHYVKVNMEGFEKIVDTLGGVDVTNSFAFDSEGDHFPAGELHLTGEEALNYTRMRHEDPRGDFGRNERQRQVLNRLVDKAADWKNSLEITNVLRSVSRNVKTDFTLGQLTDLVTKHRDVVRSVESTEVKGQGKMMGGIYYYIVGQTERDRLHDEIKSYLMDDGTK
ncbi:LCP family protein [Cohnella zeiphila]|uniref:LCP family protein n=1 Tax=Cohnella zeiphila TaxID=2761120 RepID=A0A7X0SPG1_9BACL|nr:LCP family protein [Cohnella zeiphila]